MHLPLNNKNINVEKVRRLYVSKIINYYYLIVTMDVRQVGEGITVLAVFNAIGCHPSVHIGPSLGLYGKYSTHVNKLNLEIGYKIMTKMCLYYSLVRFEMLTSNLFTIVHV